MVNERSLPVVYVALNPRRDTELSLRIRTYMWLLADTTTAGVALPHARSKGVGELHCGLLNTYHIISDRTVAVPYVHTHDKCKKTAVYTHC